MWLGILGAIVGFIGWLIGPPYLEMRSRQRARKLMRKFLLNEEDLAIVRNAISNQCYISHHAYRCAARSMRQEGLRNPNAPISPWTALAVIGVIALIIMAAT